MDVMKIKSGFMRSMISKLISREIRKKLGYKIDIQINDVVATINEGIAHVHLDVDAEMGTDEFKKVTKIIEEG